MTCKNCIHNEMCYATHTDDSPTCCDFTDSSKYMVREKGKWEEHNGITVCPCCHAMFDKPLTMIQIPATFENPNFCPNCGADMRKVENK